MTSPFLDAARQGRNGWKSYLLGIILILFAPILILVVLLIVLSIILAIIHFSFGEVLQQKEEFSKLFESYFNVRIYGFPYLVLLFFGLYTTLFTITLVFVLERIHARRFLSLFGTTNTIRWWRVCEGFVVYLAISLTIFLVFYASNPSRYKLSFILSHWIISLPFSFLLSGMTALILCLFFYGYLLQGFSNLVKKPLRLMFCYGIILATLGLIPFSEPNFLHWTNIIFFTVFTVGITLKDEGFELMLGLFIARSFFFFTILRSSSDELQTPTIFIKETTTALSLIGLLVSIVQLGLFYYICFYMMPRKSINSTE